MIRKRLRNIFSRKIQALAAQDTQAVYRMDTGLSLPQTANKQYTIDDWEPLHPELWRWETWRAALLFSPEAEALNLSPYVERLGEGIFHFQCFQSGVLQKLAAEISHLETWALEKGVDIVPPNSMHEYGCTAELLGLDQIIQKIVTTVFEQFAQQYFPEFSGFPIDHHHSFTVTYGQRYDRSLGFHADDSEITFNFCLGGDFIGSELYFQGRRCFQHMQTEHHPAEHIEIIQKLGWCIVHAGLHRHGVLPILHGERRSLIIWARSQRYRESAFQECAPWCGYAEK